MILVAQCFCTIVPINTFLLSMQKVAEVAFTTMGIVLACLNPHTLIGHRVSLKFLLELLRIVISLEPEV